MSDKDKLLRTFLDAALALMRDGLSRLPIERALYVNEAQKTGSDVCLVFAPGAGTVVGALHPSEPGADVLELFRIVVPSFEEVSH